MADPIHTWICTNCGQRHSCRGGPASWNCANCGRKYEPLRIFSRYEAIEAEATFAEQMKHRAVQAEKERDEARAEADRQRQRADALEDAARALLGSLEKCDAYGCKSAATQLLVGGDDAGRYCDSCVEDLQAPCGGPEECDFSDLDHAPALRALRALLPPGVEKGSAT